jgi:phage baseplate assembly protein gpV
MLDPYDKVLFQIAEAHRIAASSDRDGYVHEIQKDKMRICMGIRPDGSPWLSPWVSTSDHRGGSRERDMYKVGQNVRMSSPGGDHRQAIVSPGSESTSFPAPDVADQYLDSNQQPYAKTHQIGNLMIAHIGPKNAGDPSSYEVWMAPAATTPAHQEQTGQTQAAGGAPAGEGGSTADTTADSAGGASDQTQQATPAAASTPATPTMKFSISETNGIIGSFGTDAAISFSANSGGATLTAGKNTVVATKTAVNVNAPNNPVTINAGTGQINIQGGQIQVSKPPIIGQAGV